MERKVDPGAPHLSLSEYQPAGWIQWLAVLLDGTTAGDYISWIRDPELRRWDASSATITADDDPRGERIDLELVWNREPPDPRDAAAAAGFVLTPEVVAVSAHDKHREPLAAALAEPFGGTELFLCGSTSRVWRQGPISHEEGTTSNEPPNV